MVKSINTVYVSPSVMDLCDLTCRMSSLGSWVLHVVLSNAACAQGPAHS